MYMHARVIRIEEGANEPRPLWMLPRSFIKGIYLSRIALGGALRLPRA